MYFSIFLNKRTHVFIDYPVSHVHRVNDARVSLSTTPKLAPHMFGLRSLLTLKPFDSSVSRRSSNFALTSTSVSSINTVSAKVIVQGSSVCTLFSSSIRTINRNGLSADPWCNPVVIANSPAIPRQVLTFSVAPWIILSYSAILAFK